MADTTVCGRCHCVESCFVPSQGTIVSAAMTPVCRAISACGILKVEAGEVGRAHSTASDTFGAAPRTPITTHSAAAAAGGAGAASATAA